jgi:putative aldouronate transport system substrate-binding protein
MKRILSSLVILCLLLIATNAFADLPEWLNTESEFPIVKEGYDVTLSFAVSQNTYQGNWEDIWAWKYIENEMNIKVDVTQVQNVSEWKQVAFASNDLPDVLVNMGLTPNEIVNYGQEEGMLIPLDEYITKELTPNMVLELEKDPYAKQLWTCTDGHIYSVGRIYKKHVANIVNNQINSRWLWETVQVIPTTLDEWVEVLRNFKEKYPDSIPLGGSYNSCNPCLTILNALGYITWDDKGLTPAIRNGEVVLPYGDREAWGVFLTYMNTLYAEGLIAQDFYTMDGPTVDAQLSMNLFGAGDGLNTHTIFSGKDRLDWVAFPPLTSSYNSVRQWPANNYVSTGVWAITSKCEHVEAAMRILDQFFGDGIVYMLYGPTVSDVEHHYGMVEGWHYDETLAQPSFIEQEVENPPYNHENLYRNARTMFTGGFTLGRAYNVFPASAVIDGVYDEYPVDCPYSAEWHDDTFTFTQYQSWLNLVPYMTDETWPGIAFFTADQQFEINELTTIIQPIAETECARFVTGDRPLSEIDDYFDELDAAGFQDLLQYYKDYYEIYKASN